MRDGSLALLLCAFLATSAGADTIVVRQDGSGDYPDLQSAIAAATSGDVVLVGPGIYAPGPMQITTALTFRSEAGPTETVIDGQHVSRLFWFNGSCGCRLEGFTLRNASLAGETGMGCAAYLDRGATLQVSDCSFVDNWAGWDGAGIFARDYNTSVTISDCRFVRNRAEHNGGACNVSFGAVMTVTGSSFVENSSTITGALAAHEATLSVSGCLFLRNKAVAAGALRFYLSGGEVRSCTFHANESQDHGSVMMQTQHYTVFTGNIITSEAIGAGLVCGPSCHHDCNLFYANALGAILGGSLAEDEEVGDPLYCNRLLDDFTLCKHSPALPQNHGCGLKGAFPQGCNSCGPIGVENETWGGIKARYGP